jgi:tetratricopeptide (TPR) repeat protein
MAIRAFIIRPFGMQKEINFDEVERVLLAPALDRLGIGGRTTIEIVEAGNIRIDMFQRLLTADLVVADLSIHNANVFYELGIRHALCDRHTFMLRCREDKFPFDLQTDRYFKYSKEAPGASLESLVEAIRRTIDSKQADSPVFLALPNLRAQDPSKFLTVPLDFGEEVERAAVDHRPGDLRLLASEVQKDFEWGIVGLRVIGRAQFKLKAFEGAKETWEAVRKNDPDDLEANLLLGTIYERLGDLTRSTQALERALDNADIEKNDRAEASSLLARNAKTRWRGEWKDASADERCAKALRSPRLKDAYENYSRAFDEDLNHYYSGLNALAMLTIMVELGAVLPEVWGEPFESDEKATLQLASYREQAQKLAAAVDLSLKATRNRLKREDKTDVWAEISYADLLCITSKRPQRVAAAYRDAIKDVADFNFDSVRKQLLIYKHLGLLEANLAEAVKVVGSLEEADGGDQAAAKGRRVLLFTGHMMDAKGREKPRFPAEKEDVARQAIREAVVKEMQANEGVACGFAGGASGGDILFQEVCAELDIPTQLYIAIPPERYVVSSVQKAGERWVERFWKLYNKHSEQKRVCVLSEATDVLDEREYLPAWLRTKPDYGIWQRNNLWTLFNALAAGGARNLTLIALWDGEPTGDGPGGTSDLVRKVQERGARAVILNTKELFGL